MSEEFINVHGFSELDAFLKDLPTKIQRNVARGAARSAAVVVGRTAKANVPVGAPSSEGAKLYGDYAGALRDSLRVTTATVNGVPMARLVAGGRKTGGANVFYAHLIEFTGARAHTITAQNRKGLAVGGLFFQSVHHPGMRARPFMRPALDAQGGAAVVAAGNYVKKRLATKQGLDTSDVDVGIVQGSQL